MATPLDPYRGLKFVTHWTLAHALGVGTLLLVIVLLAKAWVLQIGNGSLYLAIFPAFGAIAGLQQLLLKSNGMPAPLWWLTSYFGLATGAVLATGAGNVFGIVGAVLVFGVCCGAIQMLACGQLLQRGLGLAAGEYPGLVARRTGCQWLAVQQRPVQLLSVRGCGGSSVWSGDGGGVGVYAAGVREGRLPAMKMNVQQRDLRFGVVWSLAHGLMLGAIILLAVVTTNRMRLASFWIVGLEIGLGFWTISLVQQVLLWKAGFQARWWWLTSGLAWLLMAQLGLFNEAMCLAFVGRVDWFGGFEDFFSPNLIAGLTGVLFAAFQLWGCRELRRKPGLWPLANAIGFAAVMLILATQRSFPFYWRMTAYLIGFAAGTVYGAITWGAIRQLRKCDEPADAACVSGSSE